MKDNKILILDDSNLITKIVKKALLSNQIDGYTFSESSIITHTDGFLAIEEFSKPYDIKFMITDINMPNINGDEIVEILEDTQKIKDTDIIFITTKNIAKEISSIILKKTMGIIYKPFNSVTFSEQFNKLLEKKYKKNLLLQKIQEKQEKQKKVVLEILSMFFKTPQASTALQKHVTPILDEYITTDEDIPDTELAFIAYHVATNLISNHNLKLNLKLKSFECAFYRKLNNFDNFTGDDFFNLEEKFKQNVINTKTLRDYTQILKYLFQNIDAILVDITKKSLVFSTQDIQLYYPYFDYLVNKFSKYDCMYKDKQIIIFLRNIDELMNFKDFLTTYQKNKILYKEIPKATKVFTRCETSFTAIIYKLNRLIPHYVNWIHLYIWKRFFELKIYNHIDTISNKKVQNIQNFLFTNKQITTIEYKKYKSEKIIVVSKNIDILSFFKKKIEDKINNDFTIYAFSMFAHLEIWMKTNKADRIVIDFDMRTDEFENALMMFEYFQKLDCCFNAFFMQRLYLLIDDDRLNGILQDRKKYTHIHILKKSNLKETLIINKLFTS